MCKGVKDNGTKNSSLTSKPYDNLLQQIKQTAKPIVKLNPLNVKDELDKLRSITNYIKEQVLPNPHYCKNKTEFKPIMTKDLKKTFVK